MTYNSILLDRSLASFDTLSHYWITTGPNLEKESRIEVIQKIRRLINRRAITLDLCNYRLTSVPPGLEKMASLKALYLSKSHIMAIPKIINLTHLSLEENQLRFFPRGLEYLKNLKDLNLSHNQITFIPSTIGKLKRLENLDVSYNQIIKIHSNIKKLKQLFELNLLENKLERLPEEIGELAKLGILDLGSNQLSTLPASLNQLENLDELCLQNNQFKTIPNQATKLRKLEALHLDKNQLQELPPSIGDLLSLSHLSLGGNSDLARVPLSLGHLRNINWINYEGTQIPLDLQEAITEMQKQTRNENARSELKSKLNMWKIAAGKTGNFEAIFQLDSEELCTINEWLFRLAKTNSFKYHQQDLAKTTCDILAFIASNQPFREKFLALAKANNESCEDRSLQAFNLIYTLFKQFSMPQNATFENRLSQFLQSARTFTLRDHVDEIIRTHERKTKTTEQEAVEIQLFVENALKEPLDLLIPIQSMHYADSMGNRDFIDLEKIQLVVSENHLNCLDQLEGFIEFASEFDSELCQQLQTIDEKFHKQEEENRNDPYTLQMHHLEEKRATLKEWVLKKTTS